MPYKQPVNFDALISWPQQSAAPFHIWKYHGFAKYYTWEDDPTPELMMFSPILVVAWNENKDVRYEWTLAMQSAKSRKNAWFRQLHSPKALMETLSPITSDTLSQLQEKLTKSGHRGILDADTAPKVACEYRDTILEAAQSLQIGTFAYSFCYGDAPSTFHIFSLQNKQIGSPIVPNGFVVQKILTNWLCPSKARRPKSKRNVPLKLRRAILERDGYKCVDCGRSPQTDPSCVLHVDHRVAIAMGGSNKPGNLQTLCDWCNIGKHTDIDWKLKAC